ncbi:MAG: HDOD domain-containing protein [Planctomycetota bacterium]|nr:HDOD domain-containing protein [Planctomycetota bacterium]
MNTTDALHDGEQSLRIPSLPAAVVKLNELVRDPNVGVMEIGEALGEDPELSMRVLRIANSTMFGLPTTVLDPCHAASILGINRLRSIVIQAGTIGVYGTKSLRKDMEMSTHWRHSILTAHICRTIAGKSPRTDLMDPAELHTAGLLHDMGRAILLDNVREKYLEVSAAAKRDGVPLTEAEREAFGVNHAQIGAKVVLAWDLPRNLAQAIAFHHEPWRVAKALPSAIVIAVADRLAHAVATNDLARMPQVAERRDLRFLGLGMGHLLTVATNAILAWKAIEL